MIDPKASLEVAAKGLNASPGAASGAIVFDADTAVERAKNGPVILVRWETTPDDIHGMIAAQGILTVHGGMTSHAAVVARGMGKPCVAGCDDLTLGDGSATIGGHSLQRGRRDHDRRRHRPRVRRRGAARAAADQRGLRDDPRLGRRAAPAAGARERRQPGGRDAGARVRRRGDRALPDRAHVLRRPAARRAGDDPRRHRVGPPRGARPAAAVPAVRLRGDLRGDGGAAGDDPAARPAAARVPARRGRGNRRQAARAHPRAARVEPDARHARLPARPDVPGDLRDADPRDRARRARRCRSARAMRRSSRSCTRSSASARSSRGCAS